MTQTPSLGARLKPFVLVGLTVGLVRYILEFVAPESSMFFGVYYVMPVVLLVIGVRGTWGTEVRWRTVLWTVFVGALIVWGVWNTISYTTAQFMEWNHGRFYNGGPDDPKNRAAPIAAGALGKIGWGVAQGLLTSLAGTVWCTVFGTLFVWLPAVLRRRGSAGAAA